MDKKIYIFDFDNTLIDTKIAHIKKNGMNVFDAKGYNDAESRSSIRNTELDYSDFNSLDILMKEKKTSIFYVLESLSRLTQNIFIVTGRKKQSIISSWLHKNHIDINSTHIMCYSGMGTTSTHKYLSTQKILSSVINKYNSIKDVFIFEDNEIYFKSMFRACMNTNNKLNVKWIEPITPYDYIQHNYMSKIIKN